MAVGLGATGGTLVDVAKSRGTKIQSRNVVYYTLKEYVAGQGMKVLLKNYTAQCETEYGIKLEMRNKEIYQTQGYNQFTTTYSMKTACCDGCTPTCPSGDANEITRQLLININNDPSGLVTAQAILRQNVVAANVPGYVGGNQSKGAVVTDANLAALMAFNAIQATAATHLYTDLQVSSVAQAERPFGDINMMYFQNRETVIIMSKAGFEGFACTGEVEVTQPIRYTQGAGYDIKQLEYFAKGWDESPYRVSNLNGVADGKFYNTVIEATYDQFVLSYDQTQKNAWLEYQNPEATYLCVPTGDGTTKTALKAILNAQMVKQNFKALV